MIKNTILVTHPTFKCEYLFYSLVQVKYGRNPTHFLFIYVISLYVKKFKICFGAIYLGMANLQSAYVFEICYDSYYE